MFTIDEMNELNTGASELGTVQCIPIKHFRTCNATALLMKFDESVVYVYPVLFLYYSVALANFIMQTIFITLFLARNAKHKGPFFAMLFALSLTVSFRLLFAIVAVSINFYVQLFELAKIQILIQPSLYVDYCSNFFSLSLTFFMALNRCLCFISRIWNDRIFSSYNITAPFGLCTVLSIACALICIKTSYIERKFVDNIGFVDVSPDVGYRVLINRMSFSFPCGSIVCYIALFYHFHNRALPVFTHSISNHLGRGEQKAFIQLLVTSVLYVMLHATYEILTLVSWEDQSTQLFIISVLGILNCLPELSLPLLLILNRENILKKVVSWMTSFTILSKKTVLDKSIGTTAIPK